MAKVISKWKLLNFCHVPIYKRLHFPNLLSLKVKNSVRKKGEHWKISEKKFKILKKWLTFEFYKYFSQDYKTLYLKNKNSISDQVLIRRKIYNFLLRMLLKLIYYLRLCINKVKFFHLIYDNYTAMHAFIIENLLKNYIRMFQYFQSHIINVMNLIQIEACSTYL